MLNRVRDDFLYIRKFTSSVQNMKFSEVRFLRAAAEANE